MIRHHKIPKLLKHCRASWKKSQEFSKVPKFLGQH